jgi:hypothetical protein
VILLVQALRGVPLVSPDATIIMQLAVWAIATAMALGLALLSDGHHGRYTAAI